MEKTKLKKLKDIVGSLLISDHGLRDNDMKLMTRIWIDEYNKFNEHNCTPPIVTFSDFVNKLNEYKFSNPVSIVRVRRKLQKDNPELYGFNKHIRELEEQKVKEEIKTFYDKDTNQMSFQLPGGH